MALKIDDTVVINHTLLNGVIKGAALDSVALEITYLVAYKDNYGVDQERYFLDSQVTAA